MLKFSWIFSIILLSSCAVRTPNGFVGLGCPSSYEVCLPPLSEEIKEKIPQTIAEEKTIKEEKEEVKEKVHLTPEPSALCDLLVAYSVILRHDYHLRLETSGIYTADNGSKKIRLVYISQDILDLCEARSLLVDVIEGMADYVKLSGVPLSVNDIDLRINFESFFGLYVDPLYNGYILLQDGVVGYYAFKDKVKDNTENFWYERIEPYFKSYQFVTVTRKAEESYRNAHPLHPPSTLEERFYP